MFATEGVGRICANFRRALTSNVTTALRFCVARVSRPRQTSGRPVRRQTARVTICLVLTWLSLGHVAQAADNPPEQEVVGRVARLFTSVSSIATVDMQIT